jgi:predicted phosphohydrolase
MQFAFDLISDLHIETWDQFNWEGQATSPVCVVAGDIAHNRRTVVDTLRHLGQCYQAVFYIDGNDEHAGYTGNLSNSYQLLAAQIQRIPNVVYLQDNVIVIDGVAVVGTNGWWGFDFDHGIDAEGSRSWYQEKESLTDVRVDAIRRMANTDATYLTNSIRRLQTHQDVKKIVVVTHTVPDPALIQHDIGLEGRLQFNTMGNRYMMQAMAADTENKIHTWCFGHYHGAIDQLRSGIRFVNNCRGRGDTPYGQQVYYPRRILVDF